MNTPQVLPLSPMWSLYIGLLYRWMLIVALLLYRYGVYTVTKQAPNLSLCQLLQSAHCCFLFLTLLLSGFCHSHKFKTTMHHNGTNDRRFLCSLGHDVASLRPCGLAAGSLPLQSYISTAHEYSMHCSVAAAEMGGCRGVPQLTQRRWDEGAKCEQRQQPGLGLGLGLARLAGQVSRRKSKDP